MFAGWCFNCCLGSVFHSKYDKSIIILIAIALCLRLVEALNRTRNGQQYKQIELKMANKKEKTNYSFNCTFLQLIFCKRLTFVVINDYKVRNNSSSTSQQLERGFNYSILLLTNESECI